LLAHRIAPFGAMPGAALSAVTSAIHNKVTHKWTIGGDRFGLITVDVRGMGTREGRLKQRGCAYVRRYGRFVQGVIELTPDQLNSKGVEENSAR
jgi:hypothetical protein